MSIWYRMDQAKRLRKSILKCRGGCGRLENASLATNREGISNAIGRVMRDLLLLELSLTLYIEQDPDSQFGLDRRNKS